MLKYREHRNGTINYDMCKACGGRCCKNFPCEYLPSDFDSIASIEDEIEKNNAIIDIRKQETSHEEVLYLRARTSNEDISSPQLVLPNNNIYVATKLSKRGRCRFYKSELYFYYGIEYNKWDEVAIRMLALKELESLFASKIEWDLENNKIQTIEENIQDYLAAKREFGWGGCLLPEEKRPGGALYAIPDYRNGIPHCKGPEELYIDGWDKPEHQQKLVRILEKRGLNKR